MAVRLEDLVEAQLLRYQKMLGRVVAHQSVLQVLRVQVLYDVEVYSLAELLQQPQYLFVRFVDHFKDSVPDKHINIDTFLGVPVGPDLIDPLVQSLWRLVVE